MFDLIIICFFNFFGTERKSKFLSVFLKLTKHENSYLRYVSVLQKRTEPVCVKFPSCFLNGIVVACFRYIYVPLLSVSVTFLSTVLKCNLFIFLL